MKKPLKRQLHHYKLSKTAGSDQWSDWWSDWWSLESGHRQRAQSATLHKTSPSKLSLLTPDNKIGVSSADNILNPLMPTAAISVQSAQMSKITIDGLTRYGTGCFTAVPIWQKWASKGYITQQLLVNHSCAFRDDAAVLAPVAFDDADDAPSANTLSDWHRILVCHNLLTHATHRLTPTSTATQQFTYLLTNFSYNLL